MIGIKPTSTWGVDWDTAIDEVRKIFGADASLNIVKYFNDSIFLPSNKLSDKMVYFNDTYGNDSVNSDSGNSWQTVTQPIISMSLFKNGEDYYDNAYAFSSLVDMLDNVSTGNFQSNFLWNSSYSEEYQIFFGLKDGSLTVASYTKLLNYLTGENKLLLGFLTPPYYQAYLKTSSWTELLLGDNKITLGYGLTAKDSIVLAMMTRLTAITPVSLDGVTESTTFSYVDYGSIRGVQGSNVSGNTSNAALTTTGTAPVANTFHLFYTYKLFGMLPRLRQIIKDGTKPGDDYATNVGTKWKITANIANETNHWPGIYWSYLETLLNIVFDEETGEPSNDNFSNDSLPNMTIYVNGGSLDLATSLGQGSAGLSADSNKTQEDMTKDIIQKVYGLLTPEDNSYRNNLIKATLDGWIISLHRAITGSWVGNVLSVSTGVTSTYSPVVGYINTPQFTDFPLTSWIMENYMSIYVFLLVLVLFLLLVMTFLGLRTLRSTILLFMLMCGVLLLPSTFLNNCIALSNSVTDTMYSDRFSYWAITQHQQSLTTMSDSAASNDLDSIINRNLTNSEAVKVKWMSPKTGDYFSTFFNKAMNDSGLSTNLTVFNWLFSGYFNQEEYVYGDNLVTYLYRPYASIASDGQTAYADWQSKSYDEELIGDNLRDYQRSSLYTSSNTFRLIGGESKVTYSADQEDLINLVKAKSSSGNTDYRLWTLASNKVTSKIFEETYPLGTNAGLSSADILSDSGKQFLMLTESPYYYFYNAYKTRYGDNFKGALLEKDNFKVTSSVGKATGKMRDFMDLEGLFTYVVPYLNQANTYVTNWIRVYGSDVPSYDFSKGDGSNSEAKIKKTALEQVWNLYTPWVDMIYETDVYNATARVGRKKVKIADSLNPSSYDIQGRDMIWSEADMYAKNYQISDLTDVERKLQEVQEKTYEDLMYLVNYYDFDNEALVTMAAMLTTFNFNEVFSESRVVGESIMLYPQGFELKNFNYDAFMRMTLMNATGEALMDEQDLYVRVLDKTSLITGLLLIAEDIVAVFIIPAIKLIVMILLLFLGLAFAFSSVINPPEQILQTVGKVVILPAICFMLLNIIFAYVVSIFLGEGMTGYVGSKGLTMSTNDPTITLLMLILIGCVYIYFMVKLIIVLIKSLKSYGLATLFMGAGLVAGFTTGLFNRARQKTNQLIHGGTSFLKWGARKAFRKSNKGGFNNKGESSNETMTNKGESDITPEAINGEDSAPVTDSTLQDDINRLAESNDASSGYSADAFNVDEARETFDGMESFGGGSSFDSETSVNTSDLGYAEFKDEATLEGYEGFGLDSEKERKNGKKTIGNRIVDVKYGVLKLSNNHKYRMEKAHSNLFNYSVDSDTTRQNEEIKQEKAKLKQERVIQREERKQENAIVKQEKAIDKQIAKKDKVISNLDYEKTKSNAQVLSLEAMDKQFVTGTTKSKKRKLVSKEFSDDVLKAEQRYQKVCQKLEAERNAKAALELKRKALREKQ
jgi:hypothetical protein